MARAPPPIPCMGEVSIFHPIPYLIFPNDSSESPNPLTGNEDNLLRFWIHVGLVSFGAVLAAFNFFAQMWKPLPYGRHSDSDGPCTLPIRPAYIAMHLIPGVFIFTISYFTGLHFSSPINITFYIIFVVHYLTRGIITPLAARYSESKVSVWVPSQVLIFTTFFHYVNAEFIGSVDYCDGYYYDPRFIIGLVLFITGFVINRISDTQAIFFRKSRKDRSYVVPKGFLYYLVSCPNYFGEGLQWFGWAVLTWSLAGLVWWLYTESVFIPRSRHNHKWYRNQFSNYPTHRRALIPFIY